MGFYDNEILAIFKNLPEIQNNRYNPVIIVFQGQYLPRLSVNYVAISKNSDKILANSSPYFTAVQYINNLETKRSYKKRFISRLLNFLKNLSSGLKIIR